jgi:hypothetical protein
VIVEIWDRIAAKIHLIMRWAELGDKAYEEEGIILADVLDALKGELKFFVFLNEKGEINNRDVREYYREASYEVLLPALFLKNKYPDTDYEWASSVAIISLIEKYHKLIGKMKEFNNVRKAHDRPIEDKSDNQKTKSFLAALTISDIQRPPKTIPI